MSVTSRAPVLQLSAAGRAFSHQRPLYTARLPYSSDPQAPGKHSGEGGGPPAFSKTLHTAPPNYNPLQSMCITLFLSHKPHTVILNVLCFARIFFRVRFLPFDTQGTLGRASLHAPQEKLHTQTLILLSRAVTTSARWVSLKAVNTTCKPISDCPSRTPKSSVLDLIVHSLPGNMLHAVVQGPTVWNLVLSTPSPFLHTHDYVQGYNTCSSSC